MKEGKQKVARAEVQFLIFAFLTCAAAHSGITAKRIVHGLLSHWAFCKICLLQSGYLIVLTR